jgi:hypothetical protein
MSDSSMWSGIYTVVLPTDPNLTDNDDHIRAVAENLGGRIFVDLLVLERMEREVERLRNALNDISVMALEAAEDDQ